MRKKPNLIPRLKRCERLGIREPEAYLGRWRDEFPDFREIHLEIGCGKGRFTAKTAGNEGDILFIAVERVPEAMVVAMERAMKAKLRNVLFLDRDAGVLPGIFADGEIDRIYLNFCDPWPKNRDAKRRLTSPGFLEIYEGIAAPGAQLHFKTDNLPLFDYSLEQFQLRGYRISQLTNDLHKHGIVGVMTDYEAKFHNQGVRINRCVAELKRG